ncbi:MAG: T9SS type A sorting domain-containing protein [Bacteroidia bacterium]|nr:T9SS type A sorting domain-containing protein [Bacteroidia bacterium]
MAIKLILLTVVNTFNISNIKIIIDISNLSGGVYILRTKTEKGIITKKLLKE